MINKDKISLIRNISVVQLQLPCKFFDENALLESYVLVDFVIRRIVD